MLKNQKAFTLLELMITLTIVSILVSIAIPQYTDYKRRAFDTRASVDLRNVALAEEAYYMDSESYLSCSSSACLSLPGVGALSKGVELSINASDSSFTGESSHPGGTGKVFNWDSENGGMTN